MMRGRQHLKNEQALTTHWFLYRGKKRNWITCQVSVNCVVNCYIASIVSFSIISVSVDQMLGWCWKSLKSDSSLCLNTWAATVDLAALNNRIPRSRLQCRAGAGVTWHHQPGLKRGCRAHKMGQKNPSSGSSSSYIPIRSQSTCRSGRRTAWRSASLACRSSSTP